MFYQIESSNFPYINVYLNTSYLNEDSLNNFFNAWLSINNDKKQYILIFDTTKCGIVNIKYAFKLTNFISKLKKEDKYLLYSIIYIKNKFTKWFLNLVFRIQKPIAYTFLVDNENDIEIIHKDFEFIAFNYNNLDLNFYMIKPQEGTNDLSKFKELFE